MTTTRHIDVAVMEQVLRAGADRCCYCQRHGATQQVGPAVPGYPTLIAHPECDDTVQRWRRSRM